VIQKADKWGRGKTQGGGKKKVLVLKRG